GAPGRAPLPGDAGHRASRQNWRRVSRAGCRGMSLPVRLSGIRLTRPNDAFTLAIPQLQISAGEQVALRGPSGSGKTTLLNIIAGLTRPHTGTVFVGSMAVHELSESGQRRLRRKSIGLVFQSGALIPHLTVIENVLLGQRLLHPFRRMSSFVPR